MNKAPKILNQFIEKIRKQTVITLLIEVIWTYINILLYKMTSVIFQEFEIESDKSVTWQPCLDVLGISTLFLTTINLIVARYVNKNVWSMRRAWYRYRFTHTKQQFVSFEMFSLGLTGR